MRWDMYKPNEELYTLYAERKPTHLKPEDMALLRKRDQVPITIIKRHGNRQLVADQQITASVSKKQILDAVATGSFYNQVFNIKLPDLEHPLKAVVATFYYEFVRFQPTSLLLCSFEPGKRYKVKIPIFLDNYEECASIKKGALLSKNVDYIKCYWRGGDKIPKALVVDLLETKPPLTFKLNMEDVPEGIYIRNPHHNHVLGTLKGTRRYYNLEEMPDETEVAAPVVAKKVEKKTDKSADADSKGDAKSADDKK